MRIDDADAMPCFDVLENEVPKECGFAASSLSEAVHMVAPVSRTKAERLSASPNVAVTDPDGVIVQGAGLVVTVRAAGHIPEQAATRGTIPLPRRVSRKRKNAGMATTA